MPIFFQQDIDDSTKLAIWKIEEEEGFFRVPLQREITHPHKRLQHLAGRYLLKYLFPGFPTELIRIADTRKPFLEDEAYHFSVSHCGDYAAVIVSSKNRVGIDIEVISDKPGKIMHKFLSEEEREIFNIQISMFNGRVYESEIRNPKSETRNFELLTLLWSAKEAMFKWWGKGKVDFSEMLKLSGAIRENEGIIGGNFIKEEVNISFPLHYKIFPDIVLAWVKTEA